MYAYVRGQEVHDAPTCPKTCRPNARKLQPASRRGRRTAEKPAKVNKAALAKKIKAQLDGIDVLEKLTQDLVRLGIGNMNAKTRPRDGGAGQAARQRLSARGPGGPAQLHQAVRSATTASRTDGGQREAHLQRGPRPAQPAARFDQQGRAYLQRRLEDPELQPETDTGIAAWLGHAWQLRELKDAGLVEEDVELVQLAFNSHDDVARKEYVDTGVWMKLGNGRICVTQNFRPYKAVKYIKSDDSFFQVAQVKELCVYPGDVNPRIRWEGMVPRPIEPRTREDSCARARPISPPWSRKSRRT